MYMFALCWRKYNVNTAVINMNLEIIYCVKDTKHANTNLIFAKSHCLRIITIITLLLPLLCAHLFFIMDKLLNGDIQYTQLLMPVTWKTLHSSNGNTWLSIVGIMFMACKQTGHAMVFSLWFYIIVRESSISNVLHLR